MDTCLEVARKFRQRAHDGDSSRYELVDTMPCRVRLPELWSYIDSHREDGLVLENLLVTEACLRSIEFAKPEDDMVANISILSWILSILLPGENLSRTWEELQLADGAQRDSILSKHQEERFKLTVGIHIIGHIESILNFDEVANLEEILSTLAIFTSSRDPWTTEDGAQIANSLLEKYELILRQKQNLFSATISNILRKRVKPVFLKTRTPAITPAGRKNIHPLAQPKFDPDLFDPGTKPWKFKESYIVSILNWIVCRFKATDRSIIEQLFPLLVPPLLSFIDDESLPFKAEGCRLLDILLKPLEQAKSDVLRRTNLDSVFQDAISHCLLSIPTITPEKESVHLLSFAYPAIFSVIRTRFSSGGSAPQASKNAKAYTEKDGQLRTSTLLQILRHNIISSYLHTSSPRPAEDTSISSYPHPVLSTLLLQQLTEVVFELKIETTKYLQDIIPLLTSTLTNPFGVVYLPLLNAAAECYRPIILNCWPRLSNWRGEVLAGICACWLHLCDEEEAESSDSSRVSTDMSHLRSTLQDLIKLLKITEVENVSDLEAELQTLVDADDRLGKFLL